MNALKHGADAASVILPGEDPAAYAELADDYLRDLKPRSARERFQVDTMIRTDWERRRLERIQNNTYRALLAEGPNPAELDIELLRDSPNGKFLRRLWSQIAGLERAHNKAIAEFRRLRAEAAEEAEAEVAVEVQPEPAPPIVAEQNEPNSPPKPELKPPPSASMHRVPQA